MLKLPTQNFESHIEQTFIARIKLNISFFLAVNTTQISSLACVNWDMSRIQVIQKKVNFSLLVPLNYSAANLGEVAWQNLSSPVN